MKLRMVQDRIQIKDLSRIETGVHLAFRPDTKDILNLVNRCPRLKVVEIAPSYARTIAQSARLFASQYGIEIVEDTKWGHRSDMDPYSDFIQKA